MNEFDVLEETVGVGLDPTASAERLPFAATERTAVSSSSPISEREPQAEDQSGATTSASPTASATTGRPSRSEIRELTTYRDADGTWHAHYRGKPRTLCGLDVPPFKPGRRRLPSCSDCLAAARALPVEQTPAFWGWRPVVAPPRPPACPADPPVRADGKCAVCGKKRKPERSVTYAKNQAERDPFCSTECCRVYHGTEIRRESIWSLEPTKKAA